MTLLHRPVPPAAWEGNFIYAKIFQQILESSIVEDFTTRHIFMDLLILADEKGIVDMTLLSIARRLNAPLDILRDAIRKLMEPDPHSRSPEEDGRRLVLLDSHRDWGWLIVNYEKYRATKSREDKRLYDRDRYLLKKHEECEQNGKSEITPIPTDSTDSTDSTHASASASASSSLEVVSKSKTKNSLSAGTFPAPCTPGADTVPTRPVTPYPIPETPNSDRPAPVLVLARSVEKSDFEPEDRFQDFRERHPGTKTRIGDCRAQYMRLVLDSTDPIARADSLDANQVKWLDYWANSSTPPLGLLNFLAGGDCMEPPPEIDTCPAWAKGMK